MLKVGKVGLPPLIPSLKTAFIFHIDVGVQSGELSVIVQCCQI